MKRRKRWLFLVLLLTVFQGMLFANKAFAEGISPRWENVMTVKVALGFEDGKAKCQGSVVARKGVTEMTGTMTLEILTLSGYRYVDSWSLEQYEGTVVAAATAYYDSAIPGETYRLTVAATVTNNGTPEKVSGEAVRTYQR